MRRDRFEKICSEVEHGATHSVEHDVTHEHARIVACRKDAFLVEGKEHNETWARLNCELDS